MFLDFVSYVRFSGRILFLFQAVSCFYFGEVLDCTSFILSLVTERISSFQSRGVAPSYHDRVLDQFEDMYRMAEGHHVKICSIYFDHKSEYNVISRHYKSSELAARFVVQNLRENAEMQW